MSASVILSPHFDDAVFNCWQAINQPGAVVVTVFAGQPADGQTTLWDRICGTPHSRQMMRRRQQENRQALNPTGAELINLKFLDAQYDRLKPTVEQIVEAILKAVAEPASFLVPLAGSHLYRHADHVLVRQVGLALLSRGYTVSFYADAPYMTLPTELSRKAAEALAARASQLVGRPLKAELVRLSQDQLAAKRAAMAKYASQARMTNFTSLGGLSRVAKTAYELKLKIV